MQTESLGGPNSSPAESVGDFSKGLERTGRGGIEVWQFGCTTIGPKIIIKAHSDPSRSASDQAYCTIYFLCAKTITTFVLNVVPLNLEFKSKNLPRPGDLRHFLRYVLGSVSSRRSRGIVYILAPKHRVGYVSWIDIRLGCILLSFWGTWAAASASRNSPPPYLSLCWPDLCSRGQFVHCCGPDVCGAPHPCNGYPAAPDTFYPRSRTDWNELSEHARRSTRMGRLFPQSRI